MKLQRRFQLDFKNCHDGTDGGKNQNQQLQLQRAHCVSLRMNQSLNMKYLRRALHCGCLRPQLRAARTSSAQRLEQRRRARQESSRLFAP